MSRVPSISRTASNSALHRALSIATAVVFLAGMIAAGGNGAGDAVIGSGGPDGVIGADVLVDDDPDPGETTPTTDASANASGVVAVPTGDPPVSGSRAGTPSAPGSPGAVQPDDSDRPPAKIGIPWSDTTGANAALMAVTGSVGFQGSQKVQAQAVVDHMNANGGLNGHAIEPYFHQIDVGQYVTKEGRIREGQRMCSAFTEDAKVFAIISAAVSMPENIMVECASDARTPLIMDKPDGMAYLSAARAREVAGYVYRPGGLVSERRERVVVDGLIGQGVLTTSSRIGVMYQDDPFIKEGVAKGLLPALAAHGIEPVAQAAYPDIIESPWQTYVLAFQSQDVDVVLWAATTGSVLPLLLFMRAADGQGYAPTYGVGTDEVPAGLPALGAPPEQMEKTHLVGWSPYHDTLEDEPISSSDVRCRAIMRDIGQPEVTNQNGVCEGLFFMAQALDGTASITAASLAAGVAALRSGFESVWSPGTHFNGSIDDGISIVRDGAYNVDCACFRYTSEPRALP